MSVFGIVSEFNPFHRGHKYLIDRARNMGADAVVCVMSGNATQRGELASFDKYLRAEAAIEGGADLVLELPFPWSSGSAEFFASASVFILSQFCDTVIFGSECEDIDILRSCASLALSGEFADEYSARLASGEQSAAAYTSLIKEKMSIELSSNDLLGVEYIKAAARMGAQLDFVTLKRQGSGYLESEKNDVGFDSAMALRKMLSSGEDIKSLRYRLPERSFELASAARSRGEMTDTQKYMSAALTYFRLCREHDLDSICDAEGGISDRLCRISHESATGEEFFDRLRTKRYTDAKLRRAVLFSMTGVTQDDLRAQPAYTVLLGADERGRELLAKSRKDGKIKVITKAADTKELEGMSVERQRELSGRLDAIFTACFEKGQPTGNIVRKKPYIT